MISSIVRLPEFSVPGTIIQGINESSCFTPHVLCTWGGRNIALMPNMCKYKIKLTDIVHGRVYTIVFVTFSELDLNRFSNSAGVEIFPIYLREYPIPGAEMYSDSNLAVYIPGCNRLFERLGIPAVCSVNTAIHRIMDHMALDSYDFVPKYVGENLLSYDWGTASPVKDDLTEVVVGGQATADRFNSIVDQHCILQKYFSTEVECIMRMMLFGQMIPIIDPTNKLDPLTISVRNSEQESSAYYAWIHKTDDSFPRYVTDDSYNFMNSIIYSTSCINSFEYRFNVDSDATLFDPVTLRSSTMSYNRILNAVADSADSQCQLNPNPLISSVWIIVGTYIEDLCMYDRNNELIAYIDFVWWILASASGLVNQDIFYS